MCAQHTSGRSGKMYLSPLSQFHISTFSPRRVAASGPYPLECGPSRRAGDASPYRTGQCGFVKQSNRKTKMKHQISLRRLLLYITLFAIGCAFLQFAFSSGELHIEAFSLGMICSSLALCCPIGYLIAGKAGELAATIVAFFLGLVGTPLSLVLMRTDIVGW